MTVALAVCRQELSSLLRAPGRLVGVFSVPLLLLLFTGLGIETMLRERSSVEGWFYQKWLMAGTMLLGIIYCARNVAVGFMRQRDDGQLQVMLLCAARPHDVLVGKMLAAVAECVAFSACLGMLSPLLDVYTTLGEQILGLLLVLLASITVVSWTFCLAAFSRGPQQLVSRTELVTWPALLLGGMFFPVTALEGFWQWLAWVNPLTYAIDGLRGLILASEPFLLMPPIWPFWLDVGAVAIFAIAGVAVAKWRFPRWVGPA